MSTQATNRGVTARQMAKGLSPAGGVTLSTDMTNGVVVIDTGLDLVVSASVNYKDTLGTNAFFHLPVIQLNTGASGALNGSIKVTLEQLVLSGASPPVITTSPTSVAEALCWTAIGDLAG
jgi:hypothetical protein